jgi:hypothetical protein
VVYVRSLVGEISAPQRDVETVVNTGQISVSRERAVPQKYIKERDGAVSSMRPYVWLTFGGQARERFEYFRQFHFGESEPKQSDGYLLTRLRLLADLHVTRYFHVVRGGEELVRRQRVPGRQALRVTAVEQPERRIAGLRATCSWEDEYAARARAEGFEVAPLATAIRVERRRFSLISWKSFSTPIVWTM